MHRKRVLQGRAQILQALLNLHHVILNIAELPLQLILLLRDFGCGSARIGADIKYAVTNLLHDAREHHIERFAGTLKIGNLVEQFVGAA